MKPADAEHVLTLHARGLSAAEIAERVGCASRTVIRIRKRHGLTQPVPTHAGIPITQERLDAARVMFDDGAPQREIRRTLGMSQATLMHHFPGRSWSRVEAAEFARAIQQAKRSGPKAERFNG